MSSTTAAVTAKQLKKSYKDLQVLKGIDLAVQEGTILALLGPNGAGKTTTIRILTTLIKPDSGEVTIGGIDALKYPEKVQSIIGLASQQASVDNYLTAPDNLTMIGRLYHLSAQDAKRRSTELLERFQLTDALKRPVKTFSGGMRRRLDLAASLIVTPPILFLDEPTTGLDPNSRNTMWDIIRELVREGTTVLLTTQYLEEADELADQIAVIDGGKVIAKGTADDLKKQIGGERFDVVMPNREAFEKAIAAAGKDALAVSNETLTISFSAGKGAAGLAELQRVLGRFTSANIAVESYNTHGPTLDDVFLKLTNYMATTPIAAQDGKPSDGKKK